MLRVHLGGTWHTCRAAGPRMAARGRGSIVNVSSELALCGAELHAHYCAAKGAIVGLTKALALELAPQRRARQLGRTRRHRHGPPDRHVAHAGVRRVAPGAAALDARGDRGDHRLPRIGRRVVRDRRGRLAQLGGGGVRVALVTGAATGIGQATADVLEARGFAVARNHLPGQAVSGYSAEADVSDSAAVDRMVQNVTRDLGPVERAGRERGLHGDGRASTRSAPASSGASSTPTSPAPSRASGPALRRWPRPAGGGS